LYGAIEAGGTKFICACGTNENDLKISKPIPTTQPEETLARVEEFFRGIALRSLGVACFGPLNLGEGRIAELTPKLAWRGFPIAEALEQRLGAKVTLDTDVNAAALAEARWGAGQQTRNLVYITVGTGIGGGVLINGQLVHGLLHPELGHMKIRRVRNDKFKGTCPVHYDCLEGMASGPAIAQRWGVPKAEELAADHPAWPLEAAYLAQLCVNIACTVSPEIIAFGGGIGLRKDMAEMIRAAAQVEMNGYVPLPKIVRTKLRAKAGILGAFALAAQAQEA
jgi:fructokinase